MPTFRNSETIKHLWSGETYSTELFTLKGKGIETAVHPPQSIENNKHNTVNEIWSEMRSK
jgi:hypothetical protein